MLDKKEFPILEFDTDPCGMINADTFHQKKDVPSRCLITFFKEQIARKLEAGELREIGAFNSEMMRFPLYETEHHGEKICLIQGFVGAPGMAALLEEIIAVGCDIFMVCGGAGIIRRDLALGHLVVPNSAVRDEGTSYHYLPPAREVACNPHAVNVITKELEERHLPYVRSKTWTTDAIYRETRDKVALRLAEGCATVEMEAAALFAVAQVRNVVLGQILYSGDDLSGEEYDFGDWNKRADVRENLVNLSMDILLKL